MEFFDRLDSKKRREMKLNFFLPRQEIWRIDTNQRNVKNLAMEYSRIKFVLKDSNYNLERNLKRLRIWIILLYKFTTNSYVSNELILQQK